MAQPHPPNTEVNTMGTKFYACRECWDRGCGPEPEDGNTTRFSRSVTATSYGSRSVEFDEDGDPSEGDADGFDETDSYDDSDEISCSCCAHEISNSGSSADNTDGIVALWQRDNGRVYTYSHADELGWTESEDESCESEEDDVSTPTIAINTKPAVRDDGRTIDVQIIADVAVPRETPEVQIVIGGGHA